MVTTARPAKHAALRELGADVCLDYAVDEFTGVGADVILDVMGAAYLERNLRALNPDGRLVVIGMQGGRRAELDLGLLLAKRASVIGTTLRARPVEQKAEIMQGVLRDLWPMLADGRVGPVVGEVLPLEEAARAHRLVEQGDQLGKVLLRV